ncbi:MAG TPA: SDR family NAD(P)-dependent oxidoreductase, partial [Burkholderiales bacterium]
MKNALVLGSNSDIMQAVTPMMQADGWTVEGWKRDQDLPLLVWDVCIIAIGQVAPVGLWHDLGNDWERCVRSNLFVPLHLLKRVWYRRRKTASTVIWFAGSNPQKIMPGYSAYNAAKMAVIKLVEQMDAETPDCRFIAFGPGYVKTKIHRATLEANWPNERIARGDDGHSMEAVSEAMKWCIEHREEAGGRNICVSDFKADSQ